MNHPVHVALRESATNILILKSVARACFQSLQSTHTILPFFKKTWDLPVLDTKRETRRTNKTGFFGIQSNLERLREKQPKMRYRC